MPVIYQSANLKRTRSSIALLSYFCARDLFSPRLVASRRRDGICRHLRRVAERKPFAFFEFSRVFFGARGVFFSVFLGARPMGQKRRAQVFALPLARLGRAAPWPRVASQLAVAFGDASAIAAWGAVEMAPLSQTNVLSRRVGGLCWRGKPFVLGLRRLETAFHCGRSLLVDAARSGFTVVFAGGFGAFAVRWRRAVRRHGRRFVPKSGCACVMA